MKKSLTVAAVVGILLSLFAVGGELPAAEPEKREVTFKIQICEADEFKFWFNEKAKAKLSDCKIPLVGIPLLLASTSERLAPVNTDEKGRATVGPIRVDETEKFRVAMACTSHRCLTLNGLFLRSGIVKEGENLLLVFTVPNEQAEE